MLSIPGDISAQQSNFTCRTVASVPCCCFYTAPAREQISHKSLNFLAKIQKASICTGGQAGRQVGGQTAGGQAGGWAATQAAVVNDVQSAAVFCAERRSFRSPQAKLFQGFSQWPSQLFGAETQHQLPFYDLLYFGHLVLRVSTCLGS